MNETFFRTFLMVLLMEIGSSDQLTLAAISISSGKPWAAFFGALSALLVISLSTILLASWISKIPFSMNTIAGLVMLATGIAMLWKS